MKDVLDYTESELRELPKEKLEELLDQAQNKESLFNTKQLVEKTLINSLYGSLANKWFPLFNEEMAAAITGNGRYFIRKLANYIEEKLQGMYPQEKEYIIYGDTDSCIGSTLIETSKGEMCIESLYDELTGKIEARGENNFIKHVSEDVYTNSVNKNIELESKRINYVMKHLVNKKMYEISHLGNTVTVTEDHSVILLRDNKLIEAKPRDILESDQLLRMVGDKLLRFNDFTVSSVGIQKEWVYDIEVDGNHNFFGNSILLHNSVYYHIEPFMEKYMQNNPGLSTNEYVDWANSFEEKVIQPTVDDVISDFSKELNVLSKEAIGAEREIIADAAVFTAKKKYYARVRDSEGTRFPEDDPYIKVMGLEIIKSSTPLWSKKYLKEAIPIILDKDESDIRAWIRYIKKEFTSTNLNDIAIVGGVSSLDYDLVHDTVPIGSRAAIRHNNYVSDNNLDNIYAPITGGDKCKRIFLTAPNVFESNIIAFTNDAFINEILKNGCIDYDSQFEKGFMKPLGLMVDAMNYDLNRETASLDDW